MTTPNDQKQGRGPGFALAFVSVVLVAVALIALVWQNQEPVPLEWFTVSTEVPLFVIVLVAALGGIILDEVVGFVWRSRRRRRLAEKAELKRLRAERQASEDAEQAVPDDFVPEEPDEGI